jgi:hypothetical protein
MHETGIHEPKEWGGDSCFFLHTHETTRSKPTPPKQSKASVPSVKMGRMHSHGYGPHLATRCAAAPAIFFWQRRPQSAAASPPAPARDA